MLPRRIRKQSAGRPKKNNKNKYLIIVIATGLVLVGCLFIWLQAGRRPSSPSVAGRGGGRVSGYLPEGAAPEVVSGVIMPENAKADTRLIAGYDFRAPSGQTIQFNFKWFVGDAVVQEGPEATLQPGSFRKGDAVSVEITPSGSHGIGKPFRTPVKTIGNTPPVVISVSLAPVKAVPGDVIAANVSGRDDDGDPVKYTYQWAVNGQVVPGLAPESGTFNTKGLRKKDNIAVIATPSDGEIAGKSALSNTIVLYNSAPQITSVPPTAFDGADHSYTYQVTATDPDGDKVTYTLVTAPEGMTIDPSTGLVHYELPGQVTERREVPVKIKVDDGDGGTVTQEYSFFLEPS